ncbi:MAG: sulfide:quinone oxidoreductase [Arenicella sp.]
MDIRNLNHRVTVSEQIRVVDIEQLKRLGVTTIICNRPDNEEPGQLTFEKLRTAASVLKINSLHIPFIGNQMSLNDIDQLSNLLADNQRIHLFCKSGKRSSLLWALAGMKLGYRKELILKHLGDAGYKFDKAELDKLVHKKLAGEAMGSPLSTLGRQAIEHFDVLIIGGGSGGLSVCASLLKRRKNLTIGVIEPNHKLYYQPGWTMVGGGVFKAVTTQKFTKHFIPKGVRWLQHAAIDIQPDRHLVELQSSEHVHYQQLIIATGLELNWGAIEGLKDTLGRNGVTSNYRYDLASYTWDLVQALKSGRALFTQPPMPIKCAGAPQKAMYLSADHWLKSGVLANIDIQFHSSGDSIFGVADYVPALNQYLEKYSIDLNFKQTLIKIDGERKLATFSHMDPNGDCKTVETKFDMIHVCPPQRANKFIRESGLSDQDGWLDVNKETLNHSTYHNVWGLGDVVNCPNAKTLAAVRKQVPVVAVNVLHALDGQQPTAAYDGYGSCPLTVERGKIVLAEFVYGGKHSPTFPEWLNDGTKPTRFGWFLKSRVLPYVYWHQMLKGVEWFTKPKKTSN